MAKYCIFCGNPPEDKNKEHVIPKWLISMTGNPKRGIDLGFSRSKKTFGKPLTFAFDQFTFPACTTCNSEYSQLEGDVKDIIVKILNSEELYGFEISTALDWLDKVRIGLWLGMSQLNNNPADVDPSFHIGTRISMHDRMMIIERTNDKTQKINFGGINTLSFHITPSAFTLIINNVYITNVSYPFLFSERFGFPYIGNIKLADNGKLSGKIFPGKNRITTPVIRRKIHEQGVEYYQPIYRSLLAEKNFKSPNEYIKGLSYDTERGLGCIFTKCNDGYFPIGKREKVSTKTNIIHDDDVFRFSTGINTLGWQMWIDSNVPEFEPKFDRLTKKAVLMKMKATNENSSIVLDALKAQKEEYITEKKHVMNMLIAKI